VIPIGVTDETPYFRLPTIRGVSQLVESRHYAKLDEGATVLITTAGSGGRFRGFRTPFISFLRDSHLSL
jgi:hypothetical protein